MRILFVLPQLPYPPDRGGKIVMYHFVQGMLQRHEVWVAALTHHEEERRHAEEFRIQCPRLEVFPAGRRWSLPRLARASLSGTPYKVHRFHNRNMAEWVQRCVRDNSIDVVHCQNFYTAQYVTGGEPCARVLYKENFEALLLERYLESCKYRNPLFRWAVSAQVRRTLRYEVEVCRQFDRVLMISPVDRDRFAERAPVVPLGVITPGVDLEFYRPAQQPQKPGRVIFTGSMDYFPNIDAVEFYCSQVWPKVREAIPDAEFFIVGQRPDDRVMAWHRDDGILVTGSVKDVRPYLDESAIYVVPLRIGGGVRLKILEAMAMGKAIVSTSIGAEGLDYKPGENIAIADTPEAMAQAVVSLLQSESERDRLGRAARLFTEEHGGWTHAVDQLEAAYQEVCGRR